MVTGKHSIVPSTQLLSVILWGLFIIHKRCEKSPSEHLLSFFESLDSVKEYNGFMMTVDFPIIVETSDNLWMRKVYLDTSNSAFEFFHLCHTLKEKKRW